MFLSSKSQHSLRRSQCTCTANILQSRKGILNLIVEIDSGTSLFSFIFLTIVEFFYKTKRYKLCAVCDYIQTTIYFTEFRLNSEKKVYVLYVCTFPGLIFEAILGQLSFCHTYTPTPCHL